MDINGAHIVLALGLVPIVAPCLGCFTVSGCTIAGTAMPRRGCRDFYGRIGGRPREMRVGIVDARAIGNRRPCR